MALLDIKNLVDIKNLDLKRVSTKDEFVVGFSRAEFSQLVLALSASLLLLLSSSTTWAQGTFDPAVSISGDLAESIERGDFRISADGEQVVYLASQTRDQNLVTELYSVPIDGGTPTRLSADLTFPRSVEVFSQVSRSVSPFQISPDSERVVYVSDQNTDGVYELFSVPIGGGSIVRLNADLPLGGDVTVAGELLATNGRPDFLISSDSKHVVYVADQNTDNVYELFSVPIAGGDPVQLNPDFVSTADIFEFRISADGQNVIYLADQNRSARSDLFSVPITGGVNPVRLNQSLSGSSNVSGNYLISPDSQRVVFSADPTLFVEELFSVSIDGGDLQRLNSNLPSSGDVFTYSISPDSQQVVYRADQRVNNVTEIFSVSIDGGNPVRLNSNLVNDGDVQTEFEISADGQRVVYVADQNSNDVFELFSASIAGGGSTQLNPNGVVVLDSQFTNLLPNNIFEISPDGQSVVFIVNFPIGGNDEQLLSVPIVGGTAISITPASLVAQGISDDFQIAPDSELVLFTLRFDPESLISVPIDGAGFQEVSDSSNALFNNVDRFVLSRDGQQLVYESGLTLFSASLNGSGGVVPPVLPPVDEGEDLCLPCVYLLLLL